MRKVFLAFLVFFCFSSVAFGQGSTYYRKEMTPFGGAVQYPTVTVCTTAADLITQPCNVPASIFTDDTLGIPKANPFRGDVNGNIQFSAAPGDYIVSIGPPLSPGYSFKIRIISSTGGGGTGAPGLPLSSVQYNFNGVMTGASGISTDGSNLAIKGPSPWIDATKYGVKSRTSFPTATATTNGTTAVSLNNAQDFVDGNGLVIWKAGNLPSMSTPTAPTVTSPAIHGSRTINYECVGVDALRGLTAASASTSVTNAPTAFGEKPIMATSATQTAGTVSVVLSDHMPRLTAGLQIVMSNESGAHTVDGVFTVATSSDDEHFTYTLAGSAGSITPGTYGLWARLTNTYNITAISRTGTTITITTNANHGYQVQSGGFGGYTRTIAVVQGIDQASPVGATNDMNGEYVVLTAGTNTMTLDTAINKSETETGSTAGTGLFQPTVTVYEYTTVTCPQITVGSQTVQYLVYADYDNDGTYKLIGTTLPGYPGQSVFTDYGPWQGGAYTTLYVSPNGYVPPAYVPSIAPGSAQRQMYVGKIVSGGGTTSLVVTPSVPATTSQTVMHDESIDLLAARAAADAIGGATLYLPPSNGSYIFNAPMDFTSWNTATHIQVGSPLIINETIKTNAYTELGSSIGRSQMLALSFDRYAQIPITGLASPMISSLVGPLTIRDMYFGGTSSASQTAVYASGPGVYGLTLDRDVFVGGGAFPAGTSVPLVLGGVSGITPEVKINDSEFAGYFNGMGNGFTSGGSTVTLGPNIPLIWARGNDDGSNLPPFNMTGDNVFAGRGVLFDGTYGQAVGNASINYFEYQAPTTPTVMLYGTAQFANATILISNGNNDSQPGAIVANWSPYGAVQQVILDGVVTSGSQSLVTGSLIHGLTVRNINNSFISQIGQNVEVQRYLPGHTDFGSGAANATENKMSMPVMVTGPVNYPIGTQLAAPTNFAASTSGVGTIPAGTYPFTVNAVGWNGGESQAAPQTISVTVNGSQGVATSWTAVPFAKGYNVYLSGQRQNAALVTSTSLTVTALGNFAAQSTIDGTGVSMMDRNEVIAPMFLCPEAAAPSGVAGADILYCDSTAHSVKMNANNAGAVGFVTTAVGSPTANGCVDWTGTGLALGDMAANCATYSITPTPGNCVTWVAGPKLGDAGSGCGASGGGMDTNMDNMANPTAMSQGLTCVTVNTCFVGTQAIPMTQLALGTVANRAGTFDTTALSTNRSVKWPDAATVLPQPLTAVSHQFATALNSTTGAFTLAQPTLADVAAGASPAGLFNFAASTMRVPEAAGFTASGTSTLGLDTTANALHSLINSADAILGGFASAPSGTKCLQSSGAKGLMAEAAAACGTWTDASTQTGTNKTINQEGTGNVITVVGDGWVRAAGCNNTTAGTSVDLPTTGVPTPNCLTGTNVMKSTMDFDDGTNEFYQFDTRLFHTWVGNIDVNIIWLVTSGGGSNAVKWTVQTSCSADGASFDTAFNAAQTITTNVAANNVQTVSSQATVTVTGCAVDNMMNFKIGRDTTDTFTGTARLIGVQYVIRHTGK